MAYESEVLGVLIDKNLEITAFVSWDIAPHNMSILAENIKRCLRQPNTIEYVENNNIREICLMDNHGELIQKILELKNVNVWSVIYYGLNRVLISKEFCIRFAETCLAKKEHIDNPLAMELGNLMDYEYDKVYELLDSLTQDKESIMIENNQLYNKLWFYLSLAADLKKLDIVK